MDIVDGIAGLIDQSLVRQTEEGLDGDPHFAMLETIRENALERLAERGEADAIAQQHAMYFLEPAEEAEPWIRFVRPERELWLEQLEAEQDNLRAALEWFGWHEELEHGLRLAGALIVYRYERYHWHEDRVWLEAALARSGTISAPVRAKALIAAAHLAQSMGDITQSRAHMPRRDWPFCASWATRLQSHTHSGRRGISC
jgi:predicted ATPase